MGFFCPHRKDISFIKHCFIIMLFDLYLIDRMNEEFESGIFMQIHINNDLLYKNKD